MRHLVKGKKLGRNVPHRHATLQALSNALIKHHRITTTVSKAKELRRYVEPLVTKAKVDNSHNRRQVFSKLKDKQAVTHLFEEVGPKAKDRPGGYTRVIKAGFREGDGAEMAVIELVDYNDIQPEGGEKRKRTRRAGKSKKTTPASPAKKKKNNKAKKETENKEDQATDTADDADTEVSTTSETDSENEEMKNQSSSQTSKSTKEAGEDSASKKGSEKDTDDNI